MKSIPNILIVDDLKVNLAYLEAIIKKINVKLIKALSGSEALEKTHGVNLALAIVDVRMPGMNGYEFAFKLNEKRTTEKVPVIFVTGNYFDEMEVSKGYYIGAVDYIFKPFSAEILLCKINVFLDLFNQKQTLIEASVLLKESAEELARVNATLKMSEEKYRSYIDNDPDGVFVADETGRYLEVNEAACRITGYSKEELLKMTIPDILPEESIMDGLANFNSVVKAGISNSEFIFRNKNGLKRWWTVQSVKALSKYNLNTKINY